MWYSRGRKAQKGKGEEAGTGRDTEKATGQGMRKGKRLFDAGEKGLEMESEEVVGSQEGKGRKWGRYSLAGRDDGGLMERGEVERRE